MERSDRLPIFIAKAQRSPGSSYELLFVGNINNFMHISDYRLFIFDWDGTLSTSTFLVRFSRLFKTRYNVSHVSANLGKYRMPKNRQISIDEDVGRLYSLLYDFYSYATMPTLKDCAMKTLRTLKRRGKGTAIFTDAARYRITREADENDSIRYIDFILSAGSIHAFKPRPDGLIFIQRMFRIPKKYCLYVGDMASDIISAKLAGIDSCALLDGVDSSQTIDKVNPTFTFDSLCGFLGKLET